MPSQTRRRTKKRNLESHQSIVQTCSMGLCAILLAFTLGAALHETFPVTAITSAQVFDGGGVGAGLTIAESQVAGLSREDPRTLGERILLIVINFVALLAIIAIVIGAIILLVSLGKEEYKERTKKIITYTIVALVILLFTRLVVDYINRNPFD